MHDNSGPTTINTIPWPESLGGQMRKLLKLLVAPSLLLPLLLIGSALPAQATPLPAPSISFSLIPTPLASWGQVDGSIRYHVTFNGPSGEVENFDTRGLLATPTRDLPIGAGSVTVYAVSDQGVSGQSASASFIISPRNGPDITSPITNVQGPPGNPSGTQVPTIAYPLAPVLSWNPVSGAKDYEVSLTTTGASFTYTTSSTRVVPTEPLSLAVQGVDKIWTWSVRSRSADNNYSSPSSSTFRTIWPTAVSLDPNVAPNDTNIDDPATPSITDTTLKWDPVPGASGYQLQIYTSNNFSDSNSQSVDTTIQATRFSPSPELSNRTYWWRVRGVYPAPSTQYGEWSSVRQFQRKWGEQSEPALNPAGGSETSQLARPAELSPSPGATASTNTLVLSWTPVSRASRYQVQWVRLGQSWDGARNIITNHTSLSDTACSCLPDFGTTGGGAGHQFSWRVKAIDDSPSGGPQIDSNYSSDDIYGDPASPTFIVAPASGPLLNTLAEFAGPKLQTWTTPVPDFQLLAWSRVIDIATTLPYPSYRVDLALDVTFTNVRYSYGTSQSVLVPPDDLLDNNAGLAYYYRVVPCMQSGCVSNANAATGEFSKLGTSATPVSFQDANTGVEVSDANPAGDQVRLSWTPRSTYALNDGAIQGYRVQVSTVPDFSSTVDDRRVDQPWLVSPSNLYPDTSTGNDHLYARVQAISGGGQLLGWSHTTQFRKVAPTVTGARESTDNSCADAASSGSTFSSAPLLCWDPSALTSFYEVEVYSGTNRIANERPRYSAWSNTNSLTPGSYTWRVRRIDISNRPSVWTTPRSFSIGFPAPTALTPAATSTSRPSLLLSWSAVSNATKYRVEIDQAADSFSSPLESRDTSNGRFAPTSDYPAGSYIWRVTALNGNNQASQLPSSTSTTATIGIQTVPDSPRNIQLSKGAHSVYISWQSPPDGGLPITAYRVRYRLTTDPSWVVTDDIDPLIGSKSLSGLQDNSEYQFQVSARNNLGWGLWTSSSAITTPTTPGTVGIPSLQDLGGGKVRATWGEPNNGGSVLTRYDVQVRESGGLSWPSASTTVPQTTPGQAPSTNVTLSGLSGGVSYELRVRAANDVGDGLYGTSQSIAVSLPGAVPNVSLSRGNRLATLSWGSPNLLSGEVLQGFQFRIRYRASTSLPFGSWSAPIVAPSTARTRTFTGLNPFYSYQIESAVLGLAGQGPTTTTSFIAIGAPGRPTWATNTSGAGKVYLRWKAPSNNGASISSYRVQVYKSGKWVTISTSYSSTAKARVWTGGRKGTRYSFRVAALNTAGISPWSGTTKVLVK